MGEFQSCNPREVDSSQNFVISLLFYMVKPPNHSKAVSDSKIHKKRNNSERDSDSKYHARIEESLLLSFASSSVSKDGLTEAISDFLIKYSFLAVIQKFTQRGKMNLRDCFHSKRRILVEQISTKSHEPHTVLKYVPKCRCG